MISSDKKSSVFLDGDLSHAEARRGRERREGGSPFPAAAIDRSTWKRVRLGEVLKVCHGKCQHSIESEAGKYPILATSGIIGRTDEFLYDKPSVLIGRKGTIDKPQYIDTPFWTIDTLFYTKVADGFNTKFMFYLCQTIDWSSLNEASGVPSLSANRIETFEVYLPKNADEQLRIVKSLDAVESHINTLQRLIEKYEAIKKATVNLLLKPKKDWRCGKLADVCDNFTGLTYTPEDVSDSGILVLRSSNIQNEALSFADNVMVKCPVPERATVKAGDLLVCVRNGSRKLIGKSAVITSAAEGMAFGAFMTILRATALDQLFLSYLWQSSIIQKQIEESLGATINQITNADIKRFEIYYPTSIEEQRKIAEKIIAIDNALADYKAQLEKARQLKTGMMSYFFG